MQSEKLTSSNLSTLALRLKAARHAKGLSQKELADRLSCSQSSIGSIENGRNVSSVMLPKIAQILQVDALWLAEGGYPEIPIQESNSTKDKLIAKISGKLPTLSEEQLRAIDWLLKAFS